MTVVLLVVDYRFARASSATWTGATNGDWGLASNWTNGGPPNGATDIATFASSTTTNVFISTDVTLDGIVFESGASAYTIQAPQSHTFSFQGAGITNNSGITEKFQLLSFVAFRNSSTAGTLTEITNVGAQALMGATGTIAFFQTSTAGSSIINNGAAAVSGNAFGGLTELFDNSSLGTAVISNFWGERESGDRRSNVIWFECSGRAE